MSINDPQYPGQVWDGLGPNRLNREQDASPDFEDWDQIVAELISTQEELDAQVAAAALVDQKHARVTVSSVEILAANTTPTELIAAPGAGFVNIVDRVVVRNAHGGTDYAFTTIANISYTDEAGAPITAFLATFLEAAAEVLMTDAATLLTGAGAATSPVANAAIVFGAPDADPTLGDGTLVIDLYYRTIATT